jgi:hypothetical protein
VSAQAEPNRADYQRHLMVSCVKMSEIEPAKAHEHLSRAFGIARGLHDQGRLAPADTWMVEDLARRLDGSQAARDASGLSLVGRIRRWMRGRRSAP